MWFELVNTMIAAAGLGLALMPFFKKCDEVRRTPPPPNPISFRSQNGAATVEYV